MGERNKRNGMEEKSKCCRRICRLTRSYNFTFNKQRQTRRRGKRNKRKKLIKMRNR